MRHAILKAAFTAAAVLVTSLAHSDEPPAPDARRDGLTLYVYEVDDALRQLQPVVGGQTPNASRYIDVIDLKTQDDFGNVKEPFVALAHGFLRVDKPGVYEFRLSSDDGSTLRIGNTQVINNDGLHGAKESVHGKIELAAGIHEVHVDFFDAVADQVLKLTWKTHGASDYVVVPKDAFFTQANVVHVTSPGKKKLITPLVSSRPGDGEPLVNVHPSFTLSDIQHEGFEPKIGGIDFLPDGRMVCSTWDPRGDVFLIDLKAALEAGRGKQSERRDPRVASTMPAMADAATTPGVTRFATGLAEPLGVKVVDGRIFVLQKQELTELIDHDNDGTADEYRCVAGRWPVTGNFHEFAFGLAYKDGFFYANLAVAVQNGGRTTKPQIAPDPKTGVGRGQTVRIDAKTGEIQSVAQGLRAPNGINVMPSTGDIFITDNQGDWLPSSKLMKLRPNGFYGAHLEPDQPWADHPVTPPVAWLPQGEIGNSPSQPVECAVGPWKGQVLHGDVTHGGIKRTYVETIDGPNGPVDQGCVFRFTQGLNAGVNRLAWGPDGALYVGEIGSTGNWNQQGKAKFGLQRLEFNNAPSFEMLAVRAMSNGFEIEFTQPLADDGYADEATHYTLRQWRYAPSDAYGGEKLDEKTLMPKSATVSADRKRVFLEVDGLKAGHVVYLHASDGLRSAGGLQNTGGLQSSGGEKLWSTEAWYTLNAIPRDRPGTVGSARQHNLLTDAQRAEGWKLLFDGQSLNNWRGFRKQEAPSGWQAVDGELRRVAGGGDLVSIDEFGDFELSVEWRIAAGGNSGIIWRVDERESPGWRTGPEMQILDNKRHPDGRASITSAGSCYAMIAPARDVSLAPDRWNTSRLVARGTQIECWLNNELTVKFDTASEEWKKLVANSKFKNMPNYAKPTRGRLMLQDHGDAVSFRNVKIRELK